MITRTLPLRLTATLDLLRRYGAVFAHGWRSRSRLEAPPRLRFEAQFLPAALELQTAAIARCRAEDFKRLMHQNFISRHGYLEKVTAAKPWMPEWTRLRSGQASSCPIGWWRRAARTCRKPAQGQRRHGGKLRCPTLCRGRRQ